MADRCGFRWSAPYLNPDGGITSLVQVCCLAADHDGHHESSTKVIADNPFSPVSRHARDGETLSDERRIDELLREFQMACEDAAEFNADSIRASAKHRAILRNELRSELLAVAALRAQLAGARADGERLDWLESTQQEHFGFGDVTPLRSFGVVGPIGSTVRAAIDAARATSGEDAKHG